MRLSILSNEEEINYINLGTSQINILANTLPDKVGSVKFNLNGVVKFENAAPTPTPAICPRTAAPITTLSRRRPVPTNWW